MKLVTSLRLRLLGIVLSGSFGTLSIGQEPAAPAPAAAAKSAEEKVEWIDLLSDTSIKDWQSTNFGGEGKVDLKSAEVVMDMGRPLTGISYLKEFPKDNFEIELEANRLEGSDFFCGLTFPVADGSCSYIAGGWGGTLIGLSCVDNYDAANNSTTQFMNFENGKWYRFRIRVDAKAITAWIDDKEIIRQKREGHEFRVRTEVAASKPFGFATYQSKVGLRNFRYRLVNAE